MDKLHVWPGIPVPMRLVCLCYLWCVSLSQWEWTWMSGWLLGMCYCKQCAQSARLSVWKKTRMQIFFACIVTQTLLGITPGLILDRWYIYIYIYIYVLDYGVLHCSTYFSSPTITCVSSFPQKIQTLRMCSNRGPALTRVHSCIPQKRVIFFEVCRP